jgi:hypothetical protein
MMEVLRNKPCVQDWTMAVLALCDEPASSPRVTKRMRGIKQLQDFPSLTCGQNQLSEKEKRLKVLRVL